MAYKYFVNKSIFLFIGTHAVFCIYFWLNSIFFFALDIFQPKFFMKYKIQEDKIAESPKLWKAVRVVLRNQLVGLLFSFPIYYVFELRGPKFEVEELPTFAWFMFELCVYILVEEIGFYYTHR